MVQFCTQTVATACYGAVMSAVSLIVPVGRLARLLLIAALAGAAPQAFAETALAPATLAGTALVTPASLDQAGLGSQEDAVRCLTLAIAYEAGNEPQVGQEAVAEVILNRTRHTSFPRSVCGVVFQGSARSTGCQFTFTCDGALARRLPARSIEASRRIAVAALEGGLSPHVPGALNYHANYVQPVWASTLDRVARIGAHIFYRPAALGAPVGGRTGEREADFDEAALHARVAQAYARYAGPAQPSPNTVLAPVRVAPSAPVTRVFAPWGLSLNSLSLTTGKADRP